MRGSSFAGDDRYPFPVTPEPVVQENSAVLAKIEDEPFRLPPSLPTEVLSWEDLIIESAQKFGVDPNLYANLIKLESWTYDLSLCPDGPVLPSCTSYSGAIGMAQVMYYHFGCESSDDCEAGRDPRTNLMKGAEILAEDLAIKGGDWRLGLAAYHGGPNLNPYRTIDWEYADQILAWYRESQNE